MNSTIFGHQKSVPCRIQPRCIGTYTATVRIVGYVKNDPKTYD